MSDKAELRAQKKAEKAALMKKIESRKAAKKHNQSGGVTFEVDKLDDFSTWFELILEKADIVDRNYPIRGMPVFKPYGFFMQDAIMSYLEGVWGRQEIEKVSFPTLIPESFLKREEDHVKGFGKEVFWVTHGGDDEFPERLALRPTSETAMYHMFARWIRSHRDLPLKVHQTCSVFRYEHGGAVKPLLRVREIPWNEAHTAHATEEDALANLARAWDGYRELIEGQLCYTGLIIRRAPWDQFPGGEHSEVMDTIMPDGKVLQAVGAHYLGQKFSKVFDVKYDRSVDGAKTEKEHVWMTCYGVSTRLLASVIGIHGDNNGLVLPPLIARHQVAILTLVRKNADPAVNESVEKCALEMKEKLAAVGIRATIDAEGSIGNRHFLYTSRGVPIRIVIGGRDVENKKFEFKHRLMEPRDKKILDYTDDFAALIKSELDSFTESLRERAFKWHNDRVITCSNIDELSNAIKEGCVGRVPITFCEEADNYVRELTGGEIRGFKPEEENPASDVECILKDKLELPADAPLRYAYVARAY